MASDEFHDGNRKQVKNKFLQEEDDIITKMVRQQGAKNWKHISDHLPGRTPRQIRERWTNYLDPDVNRSLWTIDEDNLLLEKVNEIGPQWSRITQSFNRRTDVSLKNRWILLQRRETREQRKATEVKPKLQRFAILTESPEVILARAKASNNFPVPPLVPLNASPHEVFPVLERNADNVWFGDFAEYDAPFDWEILLE